MPAILKHHTRYGQSEVEIVEAHIQEFDVADEKPHFVLDQPVSHGEHIFRMLEVGAGRFLHAHQGKPVFALNADAAVGRLDLVGAVVEATQSPFLGSGFVKPFKMLQDQTVVFGSLVAPPAQNAPRTAYANTQVLFKTLPLGDAAVIL